jgi:hypothetical protein
MIHAKVIPQFMGEYIYVYAGAGKVDLRLAAEPGRGRAWERCLTACVNAR